MSWLSSFFSTKSVEPTPEVHQKRLLEEPETSTPTPPQTTATPRAPVSALPQPQTQVNQPNRNKIIFGAGLGFFAFSLLITRRSFVRRRLASQAAFYSDAPGHHVEQSRKVSGAMEAVEALNIATINVLSVAMLATGGTMWYLDINSMDDARRMLRGGLGVDGSGKSEKEAEEEFEEWMASTLSRKEAKEKKRREDN